MSCMSTEETLILKQEWAALAREYKVNGMCIFQNLFRKYPDYMKLFQCTEKGKQETAWQALGSSVRLMSHTQSVMKSIGSAVGLSHDETAFTQYLLRIGGEHGPRSVGCGHYQAIFPIIVDQLVLCNGGRLSKAVWQKFFANCARILIEGGKKPVDGGPVPTDAAIRDIFREWDADHDGALSVAELELVMANLQPHVDVGRVKQMVVEADNDGDGLISFDEFLTVLRPYTSGAKK